MSPYSDSSIYYRLLVLCLLENNGALQLAREFGGSSKLKSVTDVQIKMDVSRVAQVVASIPDKARMNSTTSLSSQYPPFSFLHLDSLWAPLIEYHHGSEFLCKHSCIVFTESIQCVLQADCCPTTLPGRRKRDDFARQCRHGWNGQKWCTVICRGNVFSHLSPWLSW